MVTGYKDYRRTVAPEKVVFRTLQTSFYKQANIEVATGVTQGMFSYTIPLGYDAMITSAIVSSANPGINQVWLYLGSTNVRQVWFDGVFCFPFIGDGLSVVQNPESVAMTIKNLDTVTQFFYVTLTGFLILTD